MEYYASSVQYGPYPMDACRKPVTSESIVSCPTSVTSECVADNC